MRRRDDYRINGNANSAKVPVDARGKVALVFGILDHQQIHVAVATHLTAGRRTKENDLLRMGDLDHTSHDVVEGVVVKPLILHAWLAQAQAGTAP